MSRLQRRIDKQNKREEKRTPITRSPCRLAKRPFAAVHAVFIRLNNNNLFCSRNWPRYTEDVQRDHICARTSSDGVSFPFSGLLSLSSPQDAPVQCALPRHAVLTEKNKDKENEVKKMRAREDLNGQRKRDVRVVFSSSSFLFTTHSYIIIILLQKRAQDTWKWAENIKQ